MLDPQKIGAKTQAEQDTYTGEEGEEERKNGVERRGRRKKGRSGVLPVPEIQISWGSQ